MPVEVILPVMGETMDEATIVKWLVEVGQVVKKGEPLYQIETDKAVLEVDAPADGILQKVYHGAGSKVPVLTVVGAIATPGEDIAAVSGSVGTRAGAAAATAPAPQQVLQEAVATGRILASPRARRLAEAESIDLSHVTGSGPGGRIVERDVQAYLVAQVAVRDRAPTTPLARKAAAAAGVELTAVSGTGPGGRITKADVEAAATEKDRPRTVAPSPIARSVPMSGIRRIIAERMSTSAHTTARVTLTTDADATDFATLRAQLKDELEASLGFAISYSDILVAMTARSLREYPYMNARLAGEEIQLLPMINVGVAVDAERGLLVPVIRDADLKGIVEIARILRQLTERARTGKSLPDDLTGGTFTITNLGMYDIDAFTPIINLSECAILGIGRLRETPDIYHGQICARKRMALSLTFDHRLVDGAPAARFLQRIKAFVEQPYLLLT